MYIAYSEGLNVIRKENEFSWYNSRIDSLKKTIVLHKSDDSTNVYAKLNEPSHLHVAKEKGNRQRSAKIWLKTLEIAERGSLTDKDLKLAQKIMRNNQQILIDTFNKVKEGKKIITLKLK